jgi:hypothetical protein
MLLYSSTGHSRLWQALCRSPQHSKGYLQNHTHWYACSADLNWPRGKQEASTNKGGRVLATCAAELHSTLVPGIQWRHE